MMASSKSPLNTRFTAAVVFPNLTLLVNSPNKKTWLLKKCKDKIINALWFTWYLWTPPKKKKTSNTFVSFSHLCVFGGPFKKGDSSSPPAHPASQSTTSRSCLKRPDGCQLEMDVSWSKRLKVLLATKPLTGPVLIQRTVAYIYIPIPRAPKPWKERFWPARNQVIYHKNH